MAAPHGHKENSSLLCAEDGRIEQQVTSHGHKSTQHEGWECEQSHGMYGRNKDYGRGAPVIRTAGFVILQFCISSFFCCKYIFYYSFIYLFFAIFVCYVFVAFFFFDFDLESERCKKECFSLTEIHGGVQLPPKTRGGPILGLGGWYPGINSIPLPCG